MRSGRGNDHFRTWRCYAARATKEYNHIAKNGGKCEMAERRAGGSKTRNHCGSEISTMTGTRTRGMFRNVQIKY